MVFGQSDSILSYKVSTNCNSFCRQEMSPWTHGVNFWSKSGWSLTKKRGARVSWEKLIKSYYDDCVGEWTESSRVYDVPWLRTKRCNILKAAAALFVYWTQTWKWLWPTREIKRPQKRYPTTMDLRIFG